MSNRKKEHFCTLHVEENSCSGECDSLCGLTFWQRVVAKDFLFVFTASSASYTHNVCEACMLLSITKDV